MRPPGVLDLAPGIVAGYLPIALVVVALVGVGLYAVRCGRSPGRRPSGRRLSTSPWGRGSP